MKKFKIITQAQELINLQKIILDTKNIFIELSDLKELWGYFSHDRYAGWLCIHNDTINDFIEYYLTDEFTYEE